MQFLWPNQQDLELVIFSVIHQTHCPNQALPQDPPCPTIHRNTVSLVIHATLSRIQPRQNSEDNSADFIQRDASKQ